MAELKSLVHKRGQTKSKLTRFNTFVNAFQQGQDVVELGTRLDRAETLFDVFEDIQLKIELADEKEINSTERQEFETQFFTCIAKAKSIILNSEKTTALTSSHTLSTNGTSTETSTAVKLPTIHLPTFSGSYEDWQPFCEIFNSLIDSNAGLENIQNLHYLKSSVKGEAANVIGSLQLTGANYAVAWTLLKNRFENKRLIVQGHVKALFEQAAIERESASALRSLIDSSQKHIRALEALQQPTAHWDTLVIHMLSSKLDVITLRAWESENATCELPTFAEFSKFLQQRCQMLEAVNKGQKDTISATPSNKHSFKPNAHKQHTIAHVGFTLKCKLCNGAHQIFQCDTFKKMSVPERYNTVKNLNRCLNCLKIGHQANVCRAGTCRICNAKHNSLLHMSGNSQNDKTSNGNLNPSASSFVSELHASSVSAHARSVETVQVLLSTAVVHVLDVHNQAHPCRVLLDSASQTNFITTKIVQMLKLKQGKSPTSISGIGSVATSSGRTTQATFRSRCTSYSATLNFTVLPKITSELPTATINTCDWSIPSSINLADPDFNHPQTIDMLIGAELFFELLCIGQFRPTTGNVLMQKTLLGWVVSGTVNVKSQQSIPNMCLLSINDSAHELLQRFWEIEDCSTKPNHTLVEQACEEHFVENFRRDEHGRFCVKLPVNEHILELGDSYNTAHRRFQSLERRLEENQDLRQEYANFIREYQELGHMEPIPDSELKTPNPTFYLPHHCVQKETSLTTRLRVVYDASCKSSSGFSLNNALMVGPTVQDDLFSIVIRFRSHKFVITADIEKMYRQIQVHPQDRDLQRIIWRKHPQERLQIYRLNTVTYGTASAPFLATRCLQQLARDEAENFPRASNVTLRDFYVDDLLTGADTMEDIQELQQQLSEMMQRGGFSLRKWCSNKPEAVSRVALHDRETYHELSRDNPIRSLGLLWTPHHDVFTFSIQEIDQEERISKRSILSTTAKIFDPLGLIGPVILRAKVFLQQLWELKLEWDESLPTILDSEWRQFRQELPHLRTLQVPRRVVNDPVESQLIGFCDASERGYGACIYIRSKNSTGRVVSRLLCSKSRVAPLKKQTLPRLELCAAVLLAQLTQRINEAHQWTNTQPILCSDSSIVLAWLKASTSQLKTFVANRVAEIQRLTSTCEWRHVSTKENPADHISRGLMPLQILNMDKWWKGPSWLEGDVDEHAVTTFPLIEELPEKKKETVVLTSTQSLNLIERYSTFSRLSRITAYCLRFINNTKYPSQKTHGSPSVQEMQHALRSLVRMAQAEAFSKELQELSKGQEISKHSKLKSLSPFLDENRLIRVGGRIQNSNLSYDERHPIVLPARNTLTRLIARQEHLRQLHAGPQQLLASLRSKFWPLDGRNLTRQIVHQCITCFRNNPKTSEQMMGNLPQERVTPSRPFLRSGVDFCGPIYVRTSHRRGSAPVKAYVAIFVCFSTKAVHIELVGNLTTESFLGALKRFISRRGMCTHLFSDNATNFKGANRELREMRKFLSSELHQTELHDFLLPMNIQWQFIPARSPHFGGLWEAAVKSMKYHMKRVMGQACLSLEEAITILTQVEACMNSRPLTPMSSNPNDLSPLTPGHFLIGSALTTTIDADLKALPMNRLSRWQYVQQLTQHFWTRWSKEYLSSLQQRPKWRQRAPNLQPGDMVLVKDSNLPPLKWSLARIVEVQPGADDLVRVATIRTATGISKMAITKLCPLPKNDSSIF